LSAEPTLKVLSIGARQFRAVPIGAVSLRPLARFPDNALDQEQTTDEKWFKPLLHACQELEGWPRSVEPGRAGKMSSHSPEVISQIIATHSVGATVQVVLDTLFAQIKNGDYPPDSRLPSERALAAKLGVARNTVREALDVLE